MKKYEGHALITGASSGIGLAFAKELAEQGFNLVIISENGPQLKEVEVLLKKDYKTEVIAIHKDLSDLDSADFLFNELKKMKIQIGILINNAGFSTPVSLFHDANRSKLLDIIKLMCLTTTDLTFKFLPGMLAKGSGALIFTSSFSAHVPFPFSSVYGAAKGYILNFGINLHAEYTQRGIDILTICPGFVATDIFKKANWEPPSYIRCITPKELVQEAIGALGKKIVITPTGKQWDLKILLFLRKFISRQLLEKIVLKRLTHYLSLEERKPAELQ
ncbi:MAG: SDR family NAD(P)-dependent oxidoreductase [Verrucomicrobia bacterium]|nr:SDR family NAD(P)-dependent oxidoreductase [Verrucomicrobiota bacterium]